MSEVASDVKGWIRQMTSNKKKRLRRRKKGGLHFFKKWRGQVHFSLKKIESNRWMRKNAWRVWQLFLDARVDRFIVLRHKIAELSCDPRPERRRRTGAQAQYATRDCFVVALDCVCLPNSFDTWALNVVCANFVDVASCAENVHGLSRTSKNDEIDLKMRRMAHQ